MPESIATTEGAAAKNEEPQLTPREEFESLKTETFGPTKLEEAENHLAYVMELAEEIGVEIEFGFDVEAEQPEGYSIVFIPETRTVKGEGRKTIGMLVALVPDLQIILNTDGGQSWISRQITAVLVKSVKAIKTAAQAAGINPTYPATVAQFITTTKTGGLAGFNKVAQIFVDALKELGLTTINKNILRQVLASSAFAKTQYPRMDQSQWVMLLNSMISAAEDENLSPGIMADWLKSRDEIIVNDQEFDLSSLASVIESKAEAKAEEEAEDEEEDEAEAEEAVSAEANEEEANEEANEEEDMKPKPKTKAKAKVKNSQP